MESRLSAKLVSTIVKRGWRVVSAADIYSLNLGFLDQRRVAPHLCSRDWLDPVPDPLHLRKSGSPRNWTRTSGSVARNSHR
jgi:hypothetical protein